MEWGERKRREERGSFCNLISNSWSLAEMLDPDHTQSTEITQMCGGAKTESVKGHFR